MKSKFSNQIKLVGLGLGLLVLTSVAAGCTQADATLSVEPEKPVTVAKITQMEIGDTFIAIGKIVPKSSFEVATATGGKVTEILVKEGQVVDKGQVLYKLDKAAIETSRDQALRGLRSSIVALEDQIADTKKQQKSIATEIQELNKDALEVTGPSQEAIDMAVGQIDKAIDQLEKTQDQLDKALKTLNRQLADAKANLESQVKSFDTTLSDRVLKSPATGIVSGLNFKVGELVGPQDVLRIVSAEDYVVETWVTASQLRKLQEAQQAGNLESMLYLEGNYEQMMKGSLNRVEVVQNAQSGLYLVQLAMLPALEGQPSPTLYAGEFVEIQFETDRRSVSTLPLSAIKRLGSDAFAFTVVDGRAKRIPVALGKIVGEAVEILSGLEAYPQDTSWIVKGVDDLQDGVKVTQ